MKNSSRHWVLTLVISLWTFGSPSGLQLPTWEFTWECEVSFPHILLHFQGHENATPGLSIGPHPCKPFALVVSPSLGLRHFGTVMLFNWLVCFPKYGNLKNKEHLIQNIASNSKWWIWMVSFVELKLVC